MLMGRRTDGQTDGQTVDAAHSFAKNTNIVNSWSIG